MRFQSLFWVASETPDKIHLFYLTPFPEEGSQKQRLRIGEGRELACIDSDVWGRTARKR